MAAILVNQNDGTAAMLISETNTMEVKFFFYVNVTAGRECEVLYYSPVVALKIVFRVSIVLKIIELKY